MQVILHIIINNYTIVTAPAENFMWKQ